VVKIVKKKKNIFHTGTIKSPCPNFKNSFNRDIHKRRENKKKFGKLKTCKEQSKKKLGHKRYKNI